MSALFGPQVGPVPTKHHNRPHISSLDSLGEALERKQEGYNSNLSPRIGGECDDDDNGDYSIDPSVALWKEIDFTTKPSSVLNPKISSSSTPTKNKGSRRHASGVPLTSTSYDHSLSDTRDALGLAIRDGSKSVPKGRALVIHDPFADAEERGNIISEALSAGSSSSTSTSDNKTSEGFTSESASQIEKLKRSLQHLEIQKMEATRKQKIAEEKRSEVELSDAEAMKKQLEEMQLMKEALQREKDEMALKALLLEAEREKEKEEKQREKDDLLAALEVMKQQNKLLSSRIEKSKADAYSEVLKEREERIRIVEQMESENKLLADQLLHAQRMAELQVSSAREEMRQSIKRMEREKAELMARMIETEERARDENVMLELSKREVENTLAKLESEKANLVMKVKEIEVESQMATSAVRERLARERDEMEANLIKKEKERSELMATLAKAEEEAKMQAKLLADQLERERNELKEKVGMMENEKKELARVLQLTEMQAKENAAKFEEQLSKEQESVSAALKTIELQKSILEKKLNENENAKAAAGLSAVAAASLAEENLTLQQQMDANNKENALLQQQLSHNRSLFEEREKMVAERTAKERDELKEAVERMKKELLMERAKAQGVASGINSSISLTPTHASSFAANLGLGGIQSGNDVGSPASKLDDLLNSLPPVKSTTAATPALSPFSHRKAPQSISMIPEEEQKREGEGSSFMDLDDDDSTTPAVSSAGTNSSSATQQKKNNSKPIPEASMHLPAPHCAAATGDIDRLKVLGNLESSLLASFDASHRSPLFYAAAYNQEEVLTYIMSLCPQMVHEVDVHGDTCLHAAVSAGAHKCVELLLSASGGNASPLNQMKMSPAHLAKSVECLDLLYRHGADLSITDCNGRSPLFVACAMNRVDCAEYLIHCLDDTETNIMIGDHRGDTPLHACACNGSVDCLLLLLQCGVDPLAVNAKRLKAIDLAIRNKHNKCRELLAEYHLHYCTSGDFDSVLFLATLEGHKLVKQNTGSYDIVKTNNKSDGGSLKSMPSMFSLKTNKSLRLQKWGAWIAYEDQENKTVYYYNTNTSKGQWEMPAEVAEQRKLQQKASARTLAQTPASHKASMRLKRVGDWVQYRTEMGQTFFYNDKNGEFSFTPPPSIVSVQQAEMAMLDVISKGNSGGKNNATKDTNSTSASKDKETEKLCEGWRPYKDPETGSLFWYNEKTNVSQWECPLDSLVAATLIKEVEGEDETSGAIVVADENDLGI